MVVYLRSFCQPFQESDLPDSQDVTEKPNVFRRKKSGGEQVTEYSR